MSHWLLREMENRDEMGPLGAAWTVGGGSGYDAGVWKDICVPPSSDSDMYQEPQAVEYPSPWVLIILTGSSAAGYYILH